MVFKEFLTDLFNPREAPDIPALNQRIGELRNELEAGDEQLRSPNAADVVDPAYIDRQKYLVAQIKDLQSQMHVTPGEVFPNPIRTVPSAPWPRRVATALQARAAEGDLSAEQLLADNPFEGFGITSKVAPSKMTRAEKFAPSPLEALRIPGTRLNAGRWVQNLKNRTVWDWTQYG